MSGGRFHAPFVTVSWPTGEFGGMNLEGAVRLIDPADTRAWLVRGLKSVPAPRSDRPRRIVDAW